MKFVGLVLYAAPSVVALLSSVQSPTDVKVEKVTPDEFQEATSVIADAFAGLPINMYIDKDPAVRRMVEEKLYLRELRKDVDNLRCVKDGSGKMVAAMVWKLVEQNNNDKKEAGKTKYVDLEGISYIHNKRIEAMEIWFDKWLSKFSETRDYFYFGKFSVSPELQGKGNTYKTYARKMFTYGIGTKFLEQVLVEADEKQLPVMLTTGEVIDMNLYGKFGFKIVDYMTCVWPFGEGGGMKNENGINVYVMVREPIVRAPPREPIVLEPENFKYKFLKSLINAMEEESVTLTSLNLTALEASKVHPSELPPFTDRPKWIWETDGGGGWTTRSQKPVRNVRVPTRNRLVTPRPVHLGVNIDPLVANRDSKATAKVPKFNLDPLKLPARAAELSDIPKSFDAVVGENEEEEFEVQDVEDILNTARSVIESKRQFSAPGKSRIDWDRVASIKEQQRNMRAESPPLVVLPDTRVRCVQNELNPRILAQLLGERSEEKVQTARSRRERKLEQEKAKEKAIAERRRRILRNPWYIEPDQWFKPEDPQTKAIDSDAPEPLPYDQLRDWKGEEEIVTSTGEKIKRLSRQELNQLEVCNAFKKYLLSDTQKKDGARLPHFLSNDKQKSRRNPKPVAAVKKTNRATVFFGNK